jgi:PAS domain S-box-containing protein
MTPPEYAPLDARALAELAAKGTCTPFEKEYIRSDGSRVSILLGAATFEDDPGKGVCFVLDITVQKQAAAALASSEARYRTLFEYAPDGIVIADRQSYYLDANTSLCRMLGYTRDELIGLHASDIVAPAEIPNISSALGVLQSHSDYEREWLFRRKDGSTFPAEVIATQMPDGNLLAMIRDITDRRQAERAIRESEEHFRFLNELVEAARALVEPDAIMKVMSRMLGEHLSASRCAYADVEADGEHFTILHDYTAGCASTVGHYQLSLFGAQAVATLRRGQTLILRDVDAELLPDDGAEMFNAIGIKAIITCPLVKEGTLQAMMAVHQTLPRDWKPREVALVQEVVERCWATIARRTAEDKLRRLNAELEQRVALRTDQLQAANKELEAFSYSVSHDLRTPLRAVSGFSQAVIEDFGPLLPDEGRRQLQRISAAAERMGALIDALLAFSRLGRDELTLRPVDTARLVRDALEELDLAGSSARLEIRIGELPSCMGDEALLKQVWLNLLDNARKYSHKRDRALIEIGSERRDASLVYHVRDNGTGFDMLYAGKLFGVFQRLHRPEDYAGTGVGLATVQRIVQRHGGRVWAEAEPDRGASFYFSVSERG